MALKDDIKLKIHEAIYKGVKHAGTFIAGYAASLALKHAGLQISTEQQLGIAAAIAGGLGALLNIIKQKFPVVSWL